MEQNPDADDIEDLRRQLHIAKVDEAYTMYHPHVEPYISLYGSQKAEGNDEEEDAADASETKQTPIAKAALNSERPPMWSVVEKTMEEGLDALKQLRERRSAGDSAPAPKKYRAAANKAASNNTEPRPQAKKAQEQKHPVSAKDTTGKQGKEQPQLNRRERRRLMREAMPENKSDDDDDGGFFEEM